MPVPDSRRRGRGGTAKTLILARNRGEAGDIARLAGIVNGAWTFVTDHTVLYGHRGTPVLVTSLDCWRQDREFQEVHDLGNHLTAARLKVTLVPCPPDWRAYGFTLPKGWDVPVAEYQLVPKVPKVRWWQGLFSWMSRGQS